MSEVAGLTFEEEVRAELAELRKLLEVAVRLACPICAPAVIAETHPEKVSITRPHRNGKHRG